MGVENPQPQFVLGFPVPEDLSPESFVQLPCNTSALKAAQSLLPGHVLVVYGAPKSGKSHLLNWWQKQAAAILFKPADHLPPDGSTVAVDGLNRLMAQEQEAFFHLFNHIKNTQGKLLVTTDVPTAQLDLLPDLKSRLLTADHVEITAPQEEDLHILLTKWAADRQISLSEDVLTYLLRHADRSPHSLLMLIQKLDTLSLAQKRKVTVPLVKEALREES